MFLLNNSVHKIFKETQWTCSKAMKRFTIYFMNSCFHSELRCLETTWLGVWLTVITDLHRNFCSIKRSGVKSLLALWIIYYLMLHIWYVMLCREHLLENHTHNMPQTYKTFWRRSDRFLMHWYFSNVLYLLQFNLCGKFCVSMKNNGSI